MTVRRPLVLKDGKITVLPSSDELEGGAENFSFHKVEADKNLSIDSNQHMICVSLEVDGFLEISGGLIFL